MELFVVFKYLHIVSMFFAIALALSGEQVLRRIAASGNVVAIRVAGGRVKPLIVLSNGFFAAGLAFGVVAALTGQINLLAPWLVASYVAVAAAFFIGMTITDPWVARVEAEAAGSPDGMPSPELQALIDDRRVALGAWALMGLLAFIIFLMVVKPLG
ncbi:MAG TPA: hypothetical protein VM253_07195 [Candidatus Limnocylindrales bacterium]|nr:hypothetical protein [Candidatus Limnocylindrales bacterium]